MVFIGAALPDSLVDDYNIPNGTVALGKMWDSALWRQAEHLSVCPLRFFS